MFSGRPDALLGKETCRLAAIVSRKCRIDLGCDRTVAVLAKLVANADISCAIELVHIGQFLAMFPDARRKTLLLAHFAQSKPWPSYATSMTRRVDHAVRENGGIVGDE